MVECLCVIVGTHYSDFSVRSLLERMGKTLFFRSGGEPLILSEEQREARKQGQRNRLILNEADC